MLIVSWILQNRGAPDAVSLWAYSRLICVVTNGAMRFGCVVPFGTTHFFILKEDNPMKKTLSIILAIILAMSAVLSLTACGNKSVPEGKYKLTEATNESNKMLIGCSTLIIDADGKASIKYDIGDLSSTSAVTFDVNNGTVKIDEATADYTVDGNKITFDFGKGNTEVYEKESEEDEKDKSQAVIDVEALIDKIGTVTDQSGDAISNASQKYKALSTNEQSQVSNYDVLKKSIEDYSAMVKTAVVGRWEWRNNGTDGEKLSTLVFFDNGQSRMVVTSGVTRTFDKEYAWVVDDGLVKQMYDATNVSFSYKVDIKNKTLTDPESSNRVFNKVSDDPDYYVN